MESRLWDRAMFAKGLPAMQRAITTAVFAIFMIPAGIENVVDLMDALKKSLANTPDPKGKKPRKATAGQKEMLLPIEGKKPAAKKIAKPERRRKVG
jgi:hypothetical protein